MPKFRIAWPVLAVALAYILVALGGPVPLKSGTFSDEQMAQGELVKVDTDHQNFTVKLENNQEMEFEYNADTKVEGSQNGIQGLASDSGTKVVVYYRDESGKRVATRIEIKKDNG